MLQTRQSLVSACNYNTFPHYTNYSAQASNENTVTILNKNDHSKNVSDMLTKLPVHILSPKAVISIVHTVTDKEYPTQNEMNNICHCILETAVTNLNTR
jgi:hypothetical protein